MFRQILMATALTALALPAFADEIEIVDPYMRVSTPMSKSGAAFMQIKNVTDRDDRLVSASSDVAVRVELHTHKDLGGGKMQMAKVEGGFAIPAHGEHDLKRGGDHVMFMGLNHGLNQGVLVRVTLHFEKAGDMTIEIPVDLKRGQGMEMPANADPVTHGQIVHGTMSHGTMTHGEPKLNKTESDM
ncbi:copper chaperone PCu(A)C [uncultured Thioclava sp.]|uniref:copper chaperone PCu(A)C n=1 Tax=uncultured Thioclava sp. TaxID=473858 RepID=UPI0025D02C8E|nr:copper chaperone PCu(A)C [uncultured Thioclava sp.]